MARVTSRLHLGVAIGPDAITAVPLDRGARSAADPVRIQTASAPGSTEWCDELESAFGSLGEALSGRPGKLAVALIPPLVELRMVEYPRMRDWELDRVVSREAAKHFLGKGPWIVGAEWAVPRHPSPAPVVAIAARASLVEGIERAAAATGWMVERITAAPLAWVARALAEGTSARDGWILATVDVINTAIRLEGGRIAEVRRSREAPDATPNGDLARIVIDSPALAAAEWARAASGPELLTDEVRRAAARRDRNRIRALGAAAAAGLIIAAGSAMAGAKRDLAFLESRRAELRPVVSEVLETREGLARLEAGLEFVGGVEQRSLRWAAVLMTMSDRLPREAHLVSLRGRGDSIAMEGLAVSAGPVLEALSADTLWEGIRADAPIKQEASGDGETVERFTVAGRVATPRRTTLGASTP